ncbi:MAG: hypothetical protein JWN06_738 [Propionibacteriaceae bacterium]|nr:hypothetical protein [Propionibacteriaceae bacterium]
MESNFDVRLRILADVAILAADFAWFMGTRFVEP